MSADLSAARAEAMRRHPAGKARTIDIAAAVRIGMLAGAASQIPDVKADDLFVALASHDAEARLTAILEQDGRGDVLAEINDTVYQLAAELAHTDASEGAA